MKRNTILAIALLIPALGFAAMESHPGFFDVHTAGIPTMRDVEVDINLSGSLMALISGAAEESDPEFAEIAKQLKGIRVLVGVPEETDFEQLNRELDDVEDRIAADGWTRIVRVKEDNERVLLFTKDNGDQIDGILVIALDDVDELAIVNIVGTIDPESLGRLLKNIDGIGDIDIDMD